MSPKFASFDSMVLYKCFIMIVYFISLYYHHVSYGAYYLDPLVNEANCVMHYMVIIRRCVCIARIMPWQDVSVRLSVCLSVCHMPVLSVNGYTYSHIFSLLGSHHSSFPIPNGMAVFRWGPP